MSEAQKLKKNHKNTKWILPER